MHVDAFHVVDLIAEIDLENRRAVDAPASRTSIANAPDADADAMAAARICVPAAQ
jgi:hypothetical protein